MKGDGAENVLSKESSALISWEIEPWGALESIATVFSQGHTDKIL